MSFLVATLVGLGSLLRTAVPPPTRAPSNLPQILQSIVQREDAATLLGNQRALESVFAPGSRTASVTLDKAEKRLRYLQDWSRARQIRFTGVTVAVRTGTVRWLGPDRVKIYAVVSERYDYQHLQGNTAPCWFGLGVYHWYYLKRQQEHWYLDGDTFIDPLNQDTRLTGPAQPAIIQVAPEEQPRVPESVGARKALAYAQTYCGAAPGCGNQNRYNPRFADFNWRGGDCTNFISQVLEAGGMAPTTLWHWNQRAHDGSPAWVNATALARFLEHSGRATLFAQGSLTSLAGGRQGRPAAIKSLRLGDLIGYYERGRVVHFAIVAGFDADGYPVVMSHSADRYHEPWDLGWDRTTRYLLFHVHYPPGCGAVRN